MWHYLTIDIVLLGISVTYLALAAAGSRVASPAQAKGVALYVWPPGMRRSRV